MFFIIFLFMLPNLEHLPDELLRFIIEHLTGCNAALMLLSSSLLYNVPDLIEQSKQAAIKSALIELRESNRFFRRSPVLQADRMYALAFARQDGSQLRFVSEELQNDHQVVLAAVGQNALAIKYASIRLKNNEEIALSAIEKDPSAFHHISLSLKDDESFKAAASEKNPLVMAYIDKYEGNDAAGCPLENIRNSRFFSLNQDFSKSVENLAGKASPDTVCTGFSPVNIDPRLSPNPLAARLAALYSPSLEAAAEEEEDVEEVNTL
ncbi:MAG: DUF4116 domain-containing protein [Legionella sp.]|nr:DUF4116 domain-containing protein [Legionella sp.]